MTFHWLSCDSLSLAGLFPGKEKILLQDNKVGFFLLRLQRAAKSGTAWDLPLLASWVHLKLSFLYSFSVLLILLPLAYSVNLLSVFLSTSVFLSLWYACIVMLDKEYVTLAAHAGIQTLLAKDFNSISLRTL